MHLDAQLNFQEHFDDITSKADKTIGLLRKLQAVLLLSSLATIYKAFINLNLIMGKLYMIKHTKNYFISEIRINTI